MRQRNLDPVDDRRPPTWGYRLTTGKPPGNHRLARSPIPYRGMRERPTEPAPDATLLRAVRRSSNLTQAQVAASAGVNRGDLSRIERGVIRPSERTRYRLANALGITPAEVTEAP